MRQLGPGQYENIYKRYIGKMRVYESLKALVRKMCIIGKERKEITDLKCRDCEHCAKYGWWFVGRWCRISQTYVDPDQPACISVLPKNTK